MDALWAEFFVSGAVCPQGQREREDFIRGIPLVFWHRDAEIMAAMPVACEHSQCLELETSVGLRTFHLWVARDGSHFFVVKDAPPPAIALLATLEATADGVACEISFLTSGRPIAEFTQAVTSEKPLLMGHLRMPAFIAAHEMGLLESIYQKVEVLLPGFQQPLRDGVLLWRGSANFSAPRKGRGRQPQTDAPPTSLESALALLRARAPVELRNLDIHRCPYFLGPAMEIVHRSDPGLRLFWWKRFVGERLFRRDLQRWS